MNSLTIDPSLDELPDNFSGSAAAGDDDQGDPARSLHADPPQRHQHPGGHGLGPLLPHGRRQRADTDGHRQRGRRQARPPSQSQVLTPSVAEPGCLSRIPDPDFHTSRIPDPKIATKERSEKKFFVIPFYVATNFTKL